MEKRSLEDIRAELEELKARPQPTTELVVARDESIYWLECELADAEERPRPVWTHKGVM